LQLGPDNFSDNLLRIFRVAVRGNLHLAKQTSGGFVDVAPVIHSPANRSFRVRMIVAQYEHSERFGPMGPSISMSTPAFISGWRASMSSCLR